MNRAEIAKAVAGTVRRNATTFRDYPVEGPDWWEPDTRSAAKRLSRCIEALRHAVRHGRRCAGVRVYRSRHASLAAFEASRAAWTASRVAPRVA